MESDDEMDFSPALSQERLKIVKEIVGNTGIIMNVKITGRADGRWGFEGMPGYPKIHIAHSRLAQAPVEYVYVVQQFDYENSFIKGVYSSYDEAVKANPIPETKMVWDDKGNRVEVNPTWDDIDDYRWRAGWMNMGIERVELNAPQKEYSE